MSASLSPARRTATATTVAPAPRRRLTPARAPGERHVHSSQGRRLTEAFKELEQMPALSESRRRIAALTDEPTVDTAELIGAVEADPAVTMAVLRAANAGRRTHDRIDTARSAIELIGSDGVRDLARNAKEFDFFERCGAWDMAPQKFRLHALATQQAADRIAAETFHPHRERLALASLLHDVGKLVLIRAYPGYPRQVHGEALLPEERIHRERRELGVDHALVGGVLLRRWGLPASITEPIAHHHDPEAGGDSALLRAADMLAHYEHGDSVSPTELQRSANAAGVPSADLRRLMRDLSTHPRQCQDAIDPCPLSSRELRVLKRLSEGRVYKEIALELGLSASTVRSHLNKIYKKLGARDRAQAVLIASRRGWLGERG